MISEAALTCVFERLLDILPLQVWISLQDLLERGAVRDLSHDDRNGSPHSSDAGAATHDLRIKCDAIEHGHLLSGDPALNGPQTPLHYYNETCHWNQKAPGTHFPPPGALLLPGIAPAISTLIR